MFSRVSESLCDGLPDATMGRARRFTRDINAIDKNIKVVIPKYFEPHAIE
jgi:hypothetical protein